MTDSENPRRSLTGPVFLTLGGLLTIAALIALPQWAGPPPEGGLPDMARFFGRFHPVILHLPIGMLALVLVLETGRLISGKKTSNSTLVAVFFAAASAVVAVLLGFLLYYGSGGEYDAKLGDRHLQGGIIFACGTIAAFIVKLWVDVGGGARGGWLYWVVLLGSAGVMGFTSHDGASLTHGEDYLTKYAPNPVRQVLGLPEKKEKSKGQTGASAAGLAGGPGDPGTTSVTVSADPVIYAEIVAPILEQKCYSCHGPEKQKGKYRMDGYELLIKGGEEGHAVVAGKLAESHLVHLIDLPADDEDRMPPEGKKQLEAHEHAILKWWIERGASKDAKLSELEANDEIKQALAKVAPASKAAAESVAKKADAAPAPAPAPAAVAANPTPNPAPEPAPAGIPVDPTQVAGNPVPAPPPVPVEAKAVAALPVAPGERVVYTDIVAPILEQKCYTCHGPEKQKGKYRMDGYELLIKGGEEGHAVVAGKLAESHLVHLIDLPADDEDRMPPEGKKQLEPHEHAIIKWWIERGASKDAKVADLEASDEIKLALTKVVPAEQLAQQKAAAENDIKEAAAKREVVKGEVEKLRKDFPAALNFESQSSSGVVFTAVSMRKDFGDDQLAKLAPVLPSMVSLDLSATTITDGGTKLLAGANELKSLRLSETGVTDAGLDAIAKLPKLESLNLYGTQVTNQGIAKLGELSGLKKLYLWQTKVDAAGVDELKKRLPGCDVVLGL